PLQRSAHAAALPPHACPTRRSSDLSMSYLAAMRAAEPPGRERRRALAAAKVVVGNACRFVGQQAVQLHGGMGVTDEIAASHLFRDRKSTRLNSSHQIASYAVFCFKQ